MLCRRKSVWSAPKQAKVVRERSSRAPTNPHLPPLQRKLWTPNPTKQIFAFVFVLRVELYIVLLYSAVICLEIPLTPPLNPLNNPPGLQYKLPNLIPLRLLLSMHIFPPQHRAALPTTNIANGMRAGNELAWHRFVRVCIWDVAWARWRNEICAAVPACEAL